MRVGKQYCTRQDVEILVRKLIRKIIGTSYGTGGAGGSETGGAGAFTELSDCPGSYAGEGLHVVRVNAAEDGLEFFEPCIGDLCDVLTGSGFEPADGDCLVWNAGLGAWIPAFCGGGSGSGIMGGICDLSDVDCESPYIPEDEDILQYDAASGLWRPGSLGLKTLLDESFDNLNTAALGGQGSYRHFGAWASTLVGATTINVVAHPVSGKMIQITGDTAIEGSSYSEILTTFGPGIGGGTRIRFLMRTSDITIGTKGIYIGQASKTPLCQVYFRNTSKITFWNGTTATDLMNAASNTWYQIEIIIERGTTQYYADVFVDGVRQGAPKACGSDTLPFLYIGVYTNTTGTAANNNLDVNDLQIGTNWFWNLVD